MAMRPSCRPAPAHEAIVGGAWIASIAPVASMASMPLMAPMAPMVSAAAIAPVPADFPSPGA